MRVFVTGATGHTAKYFFQRLEKEQCNYKLICAVRESSLPRIADLRQLSLDVDFAVCDLTDSPSRLAPLMSGADLVLHIAGIHYSENVLRAGDMAGVGWFICVHTTGRFSRFKSASNDYIRIEDGIIASRNNVTILRPTLIYGSSRDANMWRLIKALHRTSVFPVIGSGANLFQPVHAQDLGNAYFDVIENKPSTFGKQYNLSGSDEITYINILVEIVKLLGKRVFFIHVPIWLMRIAVALLCRIPGRLYRCPINAEQVMRMKEDKAFSHEDAARDFGYTPMMFRDGIRLEVDEYLNRPQES